MDQRNAGNQQSSDCFKEEFQRLQYRRPVKFQCEPHIAARAQKFRAISFPVFPSIQLGRNSIRQLNPFRNYFVVGNSSLNDFALHYLLTFVNHHSNLVENLFQPEYNGQQNHRISYKPGNIHDSSHCINHLHKNNAAIIRRLMRFIAFLETPTQILQWGITERRARERGKYIIPT